MRAQNADTDTGTSKFKGFIVKGVGWHGEDEGREQAEWKPEASGRMRLWLGSIPGGWGQQGG